MSHIARLLVALPVYLMSTALLVSAIAAALYTVSRVAATITGHGLGITLHAATVGVLVTAGLALVSTGLWKLAQYIHGDWPRPAQETTT